MGLLRTFEAAAAGLFPQTDGNIEIQQPSAGAQAAIISFTNHVIIASTATESWINNKLGEPPTKDIGFCTSTRFVSELESEISRSADSLDLVLSAPSTHDVQQTTSLIQDNDMHHPRIDRSKTFRTNVNVFRTEASTGFITIGNGLANRLEVSIQVEPFAQNNKLGTELAYQARSLIPHNSYLFAQIAPGNTASLRAFLAAGYTPIASEILFF